MILSARLAPVPLGSSRHVSTRNHTYDLSNVSSRACSNMADDEGAVVLTCTSFNLLCSRFASISGTTSGKSEVDMSTPVHAVVTPLNTCRVSRACRDERVAPCCPTSATRLDTSRHDFSLCQNSWARYRVLSRRDVT